MKTVGSNFSFASANEDGDRFRQMFPDSKIVKGFSQNETKMMYVITFGLSSYFKESLKNCFYSKSFCFKFDETTTNQINKQSDGFVQYWSKSQYKIAMAYCGSLFVDHFPADKRVEHFFTFIEKIGLDDKFILHLGMDGPNFNLKFQTLLLQSNLLAEAKTTFLNIGTLHMSTAHSTQCIQNRCFFTGVSLL